MILKGNARANGQELARHLLNDRHEIDPHRESVRPFRPGNERVEVAEVRGFVADDLAGAFAEAEAIAAGTKCEKYLYSLSLNPSEPLTRAQYADAIDRAEKALGLEGQPRAVVFHVKHGREHCHAVWSRIDGEAMKARHQSFDRQALRELARELGREFGHALPEGLAADRGSERFAERFNALSHAEKSQSERSGLDPAERRATVTDAYRQADSAPAFRAALQDKGLILARGDKRGLVLVDAGGDVHSLTRQIEGASSREIRERFRLEALPDLPDVQKAKELHAALARQNAPQGPQDGFDALARVQQAEDLLKALTDAQRAEVAAIKGGLSDALKSLREREASRLDHARQAIKDAYRPEWRALYGRQAAERQAAEQALATPARRLKALLTGRAGDPFDFENRNTLVGVFRFVVAGQADMEKIDKAQAAERRGLGDRQQLAQREEARAIRSETAQTRKALRAEHKQHLTDLTRAHKTEREQAERGLDVARTAAERAAGPSSRRSSFEDRFRRAYGAEHLAQVQAEARKDAKREKAKERERGDDTGRTMKP